jgi:uncharacterized protein YeaO (DUF488 family)
MPQARRLKRPTIQIKRAYEPAARGDGYRVLVDRLWPRGIKKETLALDLWAKALAPSSRLRRWFGHDPGRWTEFVERYRGELRAPAARNLLDGLAERAATRRVTIVYGARDERHNGAVVVGAEIGRRLRRSVRSTRRRAA